MNLRATFEKFNEHFLQFDAAENKLHHRPDICAFLLLDQLVLSDKHMDMIAEASHDKIWLDTDCDKLGEVASEDDILMLVRCGVMYDDETESLSMFV